MSFARTTFTEEYYIFIQTAHTCLKKPKNNEQSKLLAN